MKVIVSETIEASAWGAVLIGFKATGITVLNHNRVEKTFLPNEDCKEIYEQGFEKFKRVYPLLKDI
ncbi:hypothetical protein [Flavobacterium sp.]|uniref:hypothetical protein n=1 Tax=Flavobacterium sp. TaxID=239 RepID=UPI001B4ED46E|nr:hypothetical protein [Flavobacterium sp.]MBP6182209.1 hypothetical protein [Flavobacterium sp.]